MPDTELACGPSVLAKRGCGKLHGLLTVWPRTAKRIAAHVWAGGMLAQTWEAHATAAAQCETAAALYDCITALIDSQRITPSTPTEASTTSRCCVFIGMDTRPSSPALVECAERGVALTGASVVRLGLCTTPMLHYAVWEQRNGSFDRYFQRLADGFQKLTAGAPNYCLMSLCSVFPAGS